MEREHPSYGIIRITRSAIGGEGVALFGSSIMHNNVIRLEILKGYMERSANEDKCFPKQKMKDKIIEVEMSYTQFAEAITSLNLAQGVPVTITNLEGKFLERCPYDDRQKVMRMEIHEATYNLLKHLEKESEKIEKLLGEKRVLSKDDRSNIVSVLKNIKNELDNNIPFLQQLFTEQMDRTVTEAKGEFETYLQNKMNTIALTAMADEIKNKEIKMSKNMIPEFELKEDEGDLRESDDEIQMNM